MIDGYRRQINIGLLINCDRWLGAVNRRLTSGSGTIMWGPPRSYLKKWRETVWKTLSHLIEQAPGAVQERFWVDSIGGEFYTLSEYFITE